MSQVLFESWTIAVDKVIALIKFVQLGNCSTQVLLPVIRFLKTHDTIKQDVATVSKLR
jgi:hypothetical protein